jgi:hypothetical protein
MVFFINYSASSKRKERKKEKVYSALKDALFQLCKLKEIHASCCFEENKNTFPSSQRRWWVSSRREHSSSFQNAFPLLLLKYFPATPVGCVAKESTEQQATWAHAEELIARERAKIPEREKKVLAARCKCQRTLELNVCAAAMLLSTQINDASTLLI